MLETLKKKSKKSLITRMVIALIIFAGCMAYSGMGLLQFIQGPTSIKNTKDISKFKGKYVTYDVEFLLDSYVWYTSVNSKTNAKTTTDMAYIVYNYDTDTCFGLKVDANNETAYDDFITASWDCLYNGKEAPKSFIVKGTLKPITGEELDYYQSAFKDIFKDSDEDMKDFVYAYYIDEGTLNGKEEFTVFLIGAFGFIAFIYAVISFIRSLGNGYLKYINEFLSMNSNMSLATIESDFGAAQNIENIWLGKRFTVFMAGTHAKILSNDTLVWAYYYRRTGKRPESKIYTYDVNKKFVSYDISQRNSDSALSYYANNYPQMMIGYEKDLEKTFRKDFTTFLNYKYNPAMNAQRDNYSYYTDGTGFNNANNGFNDPSNNSDASTSTSETTYDSTHSEQ